MSGHGYNYFEISPKLLVWLKIPGNGWKAGKAINGWELFEWLEIAGKAVNYR